MTRLLFLDLSSTSLTADERELLQSRRFAGLCIFARNVRDRFQLADYLSEVRQLAGPGFLVAVDQEGGAVLRLLDVPTPPAAMALGAADDLELTTAVARAAARGLRASGINIDFAPVADINVNPRNPVIAERAFGADPELVSRHSVAFLSGLQLEGVAATVKHFPGHGDTALDSHLALPVLQRSAAELTSLELKPFAAAVSAGVAAVMTAHIVFPQLDASLPATLSPVVISRLLRGQLGFDGVVFSDALDMKAIAAHHSPVSANVLALQAGVDAPLNIGDVRHHLDIADGVDQALRDGLLDPQALQRSRARLDALARRFPALKPDPAASWQPGDVELLAAAAARGLVKRGQLPQLDRGQPVTLVSQERSLAREATQQLVDPGREFAGLLQRKGYDVQLHTYTAVDLEPASLLEQLQRASGPVVFVSSGRAPLYDAEVSLAAELAGRYPGRFLHLALWNPYHADRLPEPALLTFGFREASLRAALAALQGAAVSGTDPC